LLWLLIPRKPITEWRSFEFLLNSLIPKIISRFRCIDASSQDSVIATAEPLHFGDRDSKPRQW
jgi:hypothetical protein